MSRKLMLVLATAAALAACKREPEAPAAAPEAATPPAAAAPSTPPATAAVAPPYTPLSRSLTSLVKLTSLLNFRQRPRSIAYVGF